MKKSQENIELANEPSQEFIALQRVLDETKTQLTQNMTAYKEIQGQLAEAERQKDLLVRQINSLQETNSLYKMFYDGFNLGRKAAFYEINEIQMQNNNQTPR